MPRTSHSIHVNLEVKESVLDRARLQLKEGGYESLTLFGEGSIQEKTTALDNLVAEIKALRAEYEAATATESNLESLDKPKAPEPKLAEAPRPNTDAVLMKLADAFLKADVPTRTAGITTNIALKALFQTGAGWTPIDTFSGLVSPYPVEGLFVSPHIPSVPTDQHNVVWQKQTSRTNASAPRAEGAALAESTLAYTKQVSPVEAVGTSLPVSDEQIADVPQMENILMNELRLLVMEEVDDLIINGSGSGNAWKGVRNLTMDDDGTYVAAQSDTDDMFTAIRKIITQIRVHGKTMPSLILVNPEDAEKLDIVRIVSASSYDSTGDSENTHLGQFLYRRPQDGGAVGTVWNIPVVETTRIAKSHVVAGDFARYAMFRDRQTYVVEQGYVNDDFTKLQKSIRAYVRAAFFVTRGSAFARLTSFGEGL